MNKGIDFDDVKKCKVYSLNFHTPLKLGGTSKEQIELKVYILMSTNFHLM